MRDPIRLTPGDARRVPWRNGRGMTEELLVRPEGASFERGDFDLRISKAGVTEDGPFSAFPGFDRWIVVTEGAGLVLSHGDSAPPALVEPLVPYAFSGEWETRAELVNGPVADFNVIVRRGKCRARVRVAEHRGDCRAWRAWMGPEAIGGALFLHVVSGAVLAAVGLGSGRRDLGAFGPGESLWWPDAPGGKTGGLGFGPVRRTVGADAADPAPCIVVEVWIW